MNAGIRRLALPSGDFFELPMPRDGGRFVPKPQLLGEGSVATNVLVPVAIGLGIGAAAIFILYQVTK